MTNILFTQEHATVVSRATRKMFDKIFAQKRLKKQATLRMLREEIKLELENAKDDYDRSIIKPIYNSLEEYTEGSCDMLAYPSTVRLDNRMIGFGLKNVPPDNWEPVMVTVMHYTSTRMEYNQEAQRQPTLLWMKRRLSAGKVLLPNSSIRRLQPLEVWRHLYDGNAEYHCRLRKQNVKRTVQQLQL